MRILLIFLLFLVSCSKKQEIISIEKEYFYRVAEVTIDGKTTFTPIKRVSVERFLYQKDQILIQNSDDEDDDEDEDDEDDQHTTCPIDITTYTVVQDNNGIRIEWRSLNEESTSFYRIERSVDLKEWDRRTVIMPNNQGYYLYYDSLQ
jgi:hypothetical protein